MFTSTHYGRQDTMFRETITHGQARRIAAEWQAPNCPGLASLATSGAILDVLEAEVERELDYAEQGKQIDSPESYQVVRELKGLLNYVQVHGVRPAQQGWVSIWDEVPVR
jgi:hypothetical protein